MLERIIEQLPDFCQEIEGINEQSTLAGDLGMSSLDYFMFINNLEEEFDVKFSDAEARSLQTIGDVVKCVEAKK